MSGSDRGLELLVGMTVMMLRSTNGAVFSLFFLGLLVITTFNNHKQHKII